MKKADYQYLLRSIEALLFSSGRAMHVDALSSILDEDPKNVRKALKELFEEYDAREGALKIYEESEKWKMLVKDSYVPVVRKVVADTELSRPTLETLAVIAYSHPKILQSDVVHRRGSSAYEHIKELEEGGFISRSPEGRSYMLKLTEKFFEYFDVEGEEDIREVFSGMELPDIGDLEVVDIPESERKEKQAELGDLEVVDVQEQEEENPFMTRKLGTKPELSAEEKSAQNSFLNDLDEKIENVQNRNDSHEEDSLLTKKEPEEEYEGSDNPDFQEIEEVARKGEEMSHDKVLDEPVDL